MHDSAHEQVIGHNQHQGVTAGEGYLYTSGELGSSTLSKAGSSSLLQDELSTSLPTAGAFTTFGQMSQRKNSLNQAAENNNNHATMTHSSDLATVSPRLMEPIKENSTASLHKQASFNTGTLSKEHSFHKNLAFGNISVSSSTNNISSMPPLEKQRSNRAGTIDCTAHSTSCNNNADGSGNNQSPSMQRNATTLDLETSPDHEDSSK